MSFFDPLTRLFTRSAPEPDADVPPVDDPLDGVGLPDSITAPPESGLSEIDWGGHVEDNVASGIPHLGYPSRPLPEEEAAQHNFAAHMRTLTMWGEQTVNALPALQQAAIHARDSLQSEHNELGNAIALTEKDLATQQQELSEQELKYQRTSHAFGWVMVAAAVLGALEVVALQPVIGWVFAASDGYAWFMSIFAVSIIGVASWAFGWLLRQWITYEGSLRIRRAMGVLAVALGIVTTAALTAVVWIRVLIHNAETVTAEESLASGVLLTAVQGCSQLIAIIHGWRHGNVRVNQLQATREYLELLRMERDDVDQQLANATVQLEHLETFEPRSWLTEHRARVADEYAEAIHAYRGNLTQVLLLSGQPDAATTLLALPLPKFIPPVDTDDGGGWVTGFVLGL